MKQVKGMRDIAPFNLSPREVGPFEQILLLALYPFLCVSRSLKNGEYRHRFLGGDMVKPFGRTTRQYLSKASKKNACPLNQKDQY